MSKLIIAASALMGTVIGAGVLGMPYVIKQSGFGLGLLNIIILGLIMTLSTLYLGEIALRTKTNHHLSGYAEKYLGKKGKIFMFISFIFGIYSAVLAYLIAEGESLSFLIFNSTSYILPLGIAFWFLMSVLLYFGIRALEEGESIGVIVVFLLITLIAIIFVSKIDLSNLSYNNLKNFFIPFGVILFAFDGFVAIPEVERILGKDRHLMKRTIIISYIIIGIIYASFVAIVLGFSGSKTPEIATLALGKIFVFLGIFTIFTSYLSLSTAMVDSLRFDFHKTKNKASLYTISIPLLLFLSLYFFNKLSFVNVLGIGGAIAVGATSILILLMVEKAKLKGDRIPEYSMPYSKVLTIILAIIFIVGAVLQIVRSII